MIALVHPRYWGGHLLMLLCVAAATSLGVWQYDAWGARRAAEAQNLTDAKPVALASVMGVDSPFPAPELGRPVEFQGTWLAKDTLFVADRELDGASGYWVVTPVLVDGTSSAMPVVRGWSATPSAAPQSGSITVTGWLQASESAGAPDPDPSDDIIEQMRIASIVEHVDVDLYSGYVVARSPVSPGLRPVTPSSIPEVSGFTALRNLLYAIEWWIFGGFAVFIWLRWCRDSLTVSDPDVTDGTSTDAGIQGAVP